MQRQKSILSFLKKPSPDDQKTGGETLTGRRMPHFPPNQRSQNGAVHNQSAMDSSAEVRGTDTPPEKVPRQIFAANLTASDGGINSGPSLFSSIMHKFVKVDDRENSSDRSKANGNPITVCTTSNKSGSTKRLPTQTAASGLRKDFALNTNKQTVAQGDKGHPLLVESDDDILGPETPGMRPLVPRLKRVQEDTINFVSKSGCSLLDTSKRVKLLQNLTAKNKNHEEVSEVNSKFEWLDPSKIKDANGRRPNNPLYDKRTLYIPPDALKKMTASQKQYWSIKSQYMDVLLFFKVGKFYELYEQDAEIGHKELDWKITLSGVGKCRQVGISESGIDDAVQKLIARGYKVGRIEQLETSEQAKSRGASSVIQRKLVHVDTPSTNMDGNIGPDAVHLLSIKEGNNGLDNGSIAYGFAFVDCAALKFWVGSISDDTSCAALGALLMQVSPKEIVYESQGLSRDAQKALKKYSLTGSIASQLTPAQPATDFVDPLEVRNLIQLKGYFKGSCNIWDHAFEGVMHHDLALCALGGLITHLSRLMLDDDIRNGDILPYEVYRGWLRMDGQTIINLEIFSNTADGGSSGKCISHVEHKT